MRQLLSLEFYCRNAFWIGVVGVLVSLVAWTSDWTGVVYVCPYCRVQRTVIGILGLLLMLKPIYHWVTAYVGGVIAFLGLHVAAAQNFMGWKRINSGTYEMHDLWFIDSFLLSGCALFIISAEICILVMVVRNKMREE